MRRLYLTPFIVSATSAFILSFAATVADAGGKDNIKIGYALANAKISLAEAVKQTETQLNGTVLKADLEREHGHYIYEIDIAKDATVTEVKFDPKSGTLRNSDVDPIDEDEQRALTALSSAQTSLVKAIGIAMEQTHAKAKSAKLEDDDGNIFFEVKLVGDGKAYEVMIEPASGKVLWTDVDDD